MTTGTADRPTRSGTDLTARVVTEVASPAILIVVQIAVAAWISSSSAGRAVLYGGLAILFASVLPLGFVLFGAAIGRWADHHVPVRQQRLLPMSTAIASLVLGAALLYLLGSPPYIAKIVIINAIGLATLTVITAWWLVSAHTAMATATVVLMLFMLGAPAAVLLPVPLATAWSRLRLRAHTPAQVMVGGAIGVVLAAGLHVVLPPR